MSAMVDTAEIGKQGGLKRAENLTAERLSEIGRKGAEARWGPKAKKKTKAKAKSGKEQK